MCEGEGSERGGSGGEVEKGQGKGLRSFLDNFEITMSLQNISLKFFLIINCAS